MHPSDASLRVSGQEIPDRSNKFEFCSKGSAKKIGGLLPVDLFVVHEDLSKDADNTTSHPIILT
jgi:hypothetical protein